MDREEYVSLKAEAAKWKRIKSSSKRIERTTYKPAIDTKNNPFREDMQLRDARELIRFNKNPQFYKVPSKSRKMYVGGPTSDLKKRTSSKFKPKSTVTFGHRPGSASRHLDILTLAVGPKQGLDPIAARPAVAPQNNMNHKLKGGGLLSAAELKDLLRKPRARVHASLQSSPLQESTSLSAPTFTQSVLSSTLGSVPSTWSVNTPKITPSASFSSLPPTNSSLLSSSLSSFDYHKMKNNARKRRRRRRRGRRQQTGRNAMQKQNWMERKKVQLPEHQCRDASRRNVGREMGWNGKLYQPTMSETYAERHPPNKVNAVLYDRSKPTARGKNSIKNRTARMNELNIQHPFCASRQLEDMLSLMEINDAGKGYHGKWHVKSTSLRTPQKRQSAIRSG